MSTTVSLKWFHMLLLITLQKLMQTETHMKRCLDCSHRCETSQTLPLPGSINFHTCNQITGVQTSSIQFLKRQFTYVRIYFARKGKRPLVCNWVGFLTFRSSLKLSFESKEHSIKWKTAKNKRLLNLKNFWILIS